MQTVDLLRSYNFALTGSALRIGRKGGARCAIIRPRFLVTRSKSCSARGDPLMILPSSMQTTVRTSLLRNLCPRCLTFFVNRIRSPALSSLARIH